MYFLVVENAKTVEKQVARKSNKLDAYRKKKVNGIVMLLQFNVMWLLEIPQILY